MNKILEDSRKHLMIMLKPATRWQEAMPSGNGTLGAMVYGNIYKETVLINHEDLWYKGLVKPLPNVSEHLPKVRELLAAGKYAEADQLLPEKLRECDYNCIPHSYHPGFDLNLEMETEEAFYDYKRVLDFETGEITVSWKEGESSYNRRLFVSEADNIIAFSIKSSILKGINTKFCLSPHNMRDALSQDGNKYDPPLKFSSSAEESWVKIMGVHSNGSEFGGVAHITAKGGTVETFKDAIKVKDADEVLVVIGVFANKESEEEFKKIKKQINELAKTYDELMKEHAQKHSEKFDRMTIEIASEEDRELSNEELLLEAYKGNASVALIERMFEFGRHLLISSSEPGSLPANLQGIWNGDYLPPWCSAFFNNENIQMNYWQSLPGNIAEVTEAYFDYYESLFSDFRENAKNIFGCRGINIPVYTTVESGLIRDLQSHCIHWTGAAGWLAQLFYDYYQFTGDREFLKNRAIPFLKEVAQFYEDFFFEDEEGYYVSSPSNSPENATPKHTSTDFMTNGIAVAINSTMDFAIAKEVISNLCYGCKLLNIEEDNLKVWESMLKKIRPYEVNDDGAIKEWMHPDFPDNYNHRHESHIYPAFPGIEIIEEYNPEIYKACKIAVEKRLVIGLKQQSGWSLSHMSNVFARLGEGDRALEVLEILSRSCVGNNLFTYHNDWRNQGITLEMLWGKSAPYQIEANMGFSAAVLEMLAFSKQGLIKVLPALPMKWGKGKAKGILCRGGIEMFITWDMVGNIVEVELQSKTTQNITIKLPKPIASTECNESNVIIEVSSFGTKYKEVSLVEGLKSTIKFNLI